MDIPKLEIVIILTVGFTFASVLGYITHRLKLSAILGYLLAGYLIGPFSSGFVVDLKASEQLAEIGVILMMFSVGLHFQLKNLHSVRNIAIPGALVQTLVASTVAALLFYFIVGGITAGIIFGLSIGVASTVVLVRMLADNNLLQEPEGHIAIGWLIVEDIITIIILILVPDLVTIGQGSEFAVWPLIWATCFLILKLLVLSIFMFTVGSIIVKYALSKVVLTRSQELFTLSVLALVFLIATGTTLLFGTSLALGAFIAGMVIGQTEVRHRALDSSMPMKDAFVVIFFLSVGMLFNPYAIYTHWLLFLGVLSVVLLVKPLTAYLIVVVLKHPFHIALTVAFALAQIGEFSFILSEEGLKYGLLPDEGFDVIVAAALVSIAINPLLFKFFRLKKIPTKKLDHAHQ